VIGALRNRIELLTYSRVDDDAGGASVAWLPGPEIWAEVTRLTSVRDVVGDRRRRLKRIAARVRYRSDFVLGQQIAFEGDNYEVVSIESDDARRRHLAVICEEVLS
jgi:SPP1 family predicted phage head-tail adaptor